MQHIKCLTIPKNITLILDQADLNGVECIKGEGTIKAASGTLDVSGIQINSTITIQPEITPTPTPTPTPTGNVINLTAANANVNKSTKTNADNTSTDYADTFNASFAEMSGSTLDGANGTDILNIEQINGSLNLNTQVTNIEQIVINSSSLLPLLTITNADINKVTNNSSLLRTDHNNTNTEFNFDGTGATSGQNLYLKSNLTYQASANFAGSAGGISDHLILRDGTNIQAATVTNFDSLFVDTNATVSITAAQHNNFASIVDLLNGNTNAINLSGAGNVTGSAKIETYKLSDTANQTFTVGTAAQNVIESGTITNVNLGGQTLTGNYTSFDSDDTFTATNGANLSGVNNSNALGTSSTLIVTGNITLSDTQFAAFNNGFSGSTLQATGNNVITVTTLSGGVTETLDSEIETLIIQNILIKSAITLNAGAQNVTFGSAADNLTLNAGTYTGTYDMGGGIGSGSDSLYLNGTTDISAATFIKFVGESIDFGLSNTFITMTDLQYDNHVENAAVTAPGITTVTISDTASISVEGTDRNINNFILASTGKDTIKITMSNSNTTQNTINITAGGADIITLNNRAIQSGTANDYVTINGFNTAGADKLITQLNNVNLNTAFQTISTADNLGTNTLSTIEISTGTVAGLTDVSNGGTIETFIANRVLDYTANSSHTFIVYQTGGGAGIYQASIGADLGNVNDLDTNEFGIELIAILDSVALGSLDQSHFI